MLAAFRKNVSHQEVERILSEVEAWWETQFEQTGIEWLPLAGIENFLFQDLGYEDMDEFEDALQGTFQEFLGAFPHIEVKEIEEKWYLKVDMPKPQPSRRLQVSITSSKQLLDTVLYQAPGAEIEIPSLGFQIGSSQRRHIDTLYNHLLVAKDNLENHADHLGEDASEKLRIMQTVEEIGSLLDVESSFDVVIIDRPGLSELKPSDGMQILPLEGDAD
mmetsp:Transcript_63360/g.151188  ORF Transcript_63360/g.151188 Transcript_63360/m.151188 type:complete len:218 (+) Transcript_63360:140-793(+)|eukprot:CAMPEP_0178407290 /NCGR_PEP_ID=MMETSP0689_2-20121128/19353_1 /TAXON_ID=160604 /ORGANISM="Amphidinium massartii, Strain CS-259" /LENGTH=217 /DNA_ID=CAMNT_0020028361 /DNA_START=134 /DNA_END=787 /DNA_ORIENTATION=+